MNNRDGEALGTANRLKTTLEERMAPLRSRISDGRRLLHLAEEEMELAVAQLTPVLVGDKRISTEALDRSFARLRAARKLVDDLEGLLASELAAAGRDGLV